MGTDAKELRKTYFDRSLRGWLVDLVAATLQDLPGSEGMESFKYNNKDMYATDILDPFFQRLAEACVENRPADLPGFMLNWVLKQQGPEPKALREFVATWLRGSGHAPKSEQDALDELEVLEAKHKALVTALCSTGLGLCMLQKLAEGPTSFADLGLPLEGADVEPLKLLQMRLDHAESVQQEHSKCAERNQAFEALQSEVVKLRAENDKLRAENENLQLELQSALAELKTALAQLQTLSQKDDQVTEKEPPKPPGRPMTECINLILQKLKEDPKNDVSSAGGAWAFFKPDDTNSVNRDSFHEQVSELDILTPEEVLSLLDYMDYGGSGSIDFDEWKAGLMMALANSGDMHALPTEEEFNAMMFRVKAKLMTKGMTAKQAFSACDFDNSKELSHDEFVTGMLNVKLGLSKKEITQLFFSMDADEGGTVDLEEFEDAIDEGAEADTMKEVSIPIFRQLGEALIQKGCLEECQKLATHVGSDMLSFDGFVQLLRIGHPEMTLSSIMRLWCIVDKCGKGGVGFANIPDLISNIMASTTSSQRSAFAAAVA